MTGKKSQSQRFKEAARELGADESGAEFERAFKKIVPAKQGSKPIKPLRHKGGQSKGGRD